MASMRAAIHISEDVAITTYDKSSQWPRAFSDGKRTGARIGNLCQLTDDDLRRHFDALGSSLELCVAAEPIDESIRPARIISQNNTMPGNAMKNVNT